MAGVHTRAMFRNRVAVLPLAEGKDGDAGVYETFPIPESATVACYIYTADARAGYAAESEVGVTPARLFFPSDPGAAKGTRFQEALGGRLFRAMAPAQARGGDNNLYCCTCEAID